MKKRKLQRRLTVGFAILIAVSLVFANFTAFADSSDPSVQTGSGDGGSSGSEGGSDGNGGGSDSGGNNSDGGDSQGGGQDGGGSNTVDTDGGSGSSGNSGGNQDANGVDTDGSGENSDQDTGGGSGSGGNASQDANGVDTDGSASNSENSGDASEAGSEEDGSGNSQGEGSSGGGSGEDGETSEEESTQSSDSDKEKDDDGEEEDEYFRVSLKNSDNVSLTVTYEKENEQDGDGADTDSSSNPSDSASGDESSQDEESQGSGEESSQEEDSQSEEGDEGSQEENEQDSQSESGDGSDPLFKATTGNGAEIVTVQDGDQVAKGTVLTITAELVELEEDEASPDEDGEEEEQPFKEIILGQPSDGEDNPYFTKDGDEESQAEDKDEETTQLENEQDPEDEESQVEHGDSEEEDDQDNLESESSAVESIREFLSQKGANVKAYIPSVDLDEDGDVSKAFSPTPTPTPMPGLPGAGGDEESGEESKEESEEESEDGAEDIGGDEEPDGENGQDGGEEEDKELERRFTVTVNGKEYVSDENGVVTVEFEVEERTEISAVEDFKVSVTGPYGDMDLDEYAELLSEAFEMDLTAEDLPQIIVTYVKEEFVSELEEEEADGDESVDASEEASEEEEDENKITVEDGDWVPSGTQLTITSLVPDAMKDFMPIAFTIIIDGEFYHPEEEDKDAAEYEVLYILTGPVEIGAGRQIMAMALNGTYRINVLSTITSGTYTTSANTINVRDTNDLTAAQWAQARTAAGMPLVTVAGTYDVVFSGVTPSFSGTLWTSGVGSSATLVNVDGGGYTSVAQPTGNVVGASTAWSFQNIHLSQNTGTSLTASTVTMESTASGGLYASGTIVVNGATMTYVRCGTLQLQNSATVPITANHLQSGGNTLFTNLTIAGSFTGSGTVTAITAGGTLTISNQAGLGNVPLTAAAFNISTGTWTNGSNNKSGTGAVTLSGGATLTLPSTSTSFSSTITVSGGATLNTQTTTAITTTYITINNGTYNASGAVSATNTTYGVRVGNSAANGYLNVAGNLTSSGPITAGDGNYSRIVAGGAVQGTEITVDGGNTGGASRVTGTTITATTGDITVSGAGAYISGTGRVSTNATTGGGIEVSGAGAYILSADNGITSRTSIEVSGANAYVRANGTSGLVTAGTFITVTGADAYVAAPQGTTANSAGYVTAGSYITVTSGGGANLTTAPINANVVANTYMTAGTYIGINVASGKIRAGGNITANGQSSNRGIWVNGTGATMVSGGNVSAAAGGILVGTTTVGQTTTGNNASISATGTVTSYSTITVLGANATSRASITGTTVTAGNSVAGDFVITNGLITGDVQVSATNPANHWADMYLLGTTQITGTATVRGHLYVGSNQATTATVGGLAYVGRGSATDYGNTAIGDSTGAQGWLATLNLGASGLNTYNLFVYPGGNIQSAGPVVIRNGATFYNNTVFEINGTVTINNDVTFSGAFHGNHGNTTIARPAIVRGVGASPSVTQTAGKLNIECEVEFQIDYTFDSTADTIFIRRNGTSTWGTVLGPNTLISSSILQFEGGWIGYGAGTYSGSIQGTGTYPYSGGHVRHTNLPVAANYVVTANGGTVKADGILEFSATVPAGGHSYPNTTGVLTVEYNSAATAGDNPFGTVHYSGTANGAVILHTSTAASRSSILVNGFFRTVGAVNIGDTASGGPTGTGTTSYPRFGAGSAPEYSRVQSDGGVVTVNWVNGTIGTIITGSTAVPAVSLNNGYASSLIHLVEANTAAAQKDGGSRPVDNLVAGGDLSGAGSINMTNAHLGTIYSTNSYRFTVAAYTGSSTRLVNTINAHGGGVAVAATDAGKYNNVFLGGGLATNNVISGGVFNNIWLGGNSYPVNNTATVGVDISGAGTVNAIFGGGDGVAYPSQSPLTGSVTTGPAVASSTITIKSNTTATTGVFGSGTSSSAVQNTTIALDPTVVLTGDIYMGGYGGAISFYTTTGHSTSSAYNSSTKTSGSTAGSISGTSSISLANGQRVTGGIYGGSYTRDAVNVSSALAYNVANASITLGSANGTNTLVRVGSIHGGARDNLGVVNNATITLNGSQTNRVDGSIYGGSLGTVATNAAGNVTTGNVGAVNTVAIAVGGTATNNIFGSIYAGAEGNGNVANLAAGSASITFNGTNGSTAVSGSVYGGSADTVTTPASQGITGFSGARNVQIAFNSTTTGSDTVTVTGNVYGGSAANGTVYNPYIHMNSAITTVANIFGGSAGEGLVSGNHSASTVSLWETAPTAAGGNTEIRLTDGTVATSVYAGSEDAGSNTGLTQIVIPMSSNADVAGGAVGDGIFGGGMSTASVADVYIYYGEDILSGTDSGMYGGGKDDSTVDRVQIDVGDTTTATYSHNIYGGGYQGTAAITSQALINVSNDATVGSGGTDGFLYGGSNGNNGGTAGASGEVANVEINIYGTVHGNLFGGSHLSTSGDVTGNAVLTVNGGTVLTVGSNRIFGGGDRGTSTVGGSYINLNGGTIGAVASPTHDIVYGGSYQGGGVTNTNIYVYNGATVNGRIHGGGMEDNANGGSTSTNIHIGHDVVASGSTPPASTDTQSVYAAGPDIGGGDGIVRGNVYGGSKDGGVVGTTNVYVGTATRVGTVGNGTTILSDVYGGGEGGAVVAANVTMSNASSHVTQNIYGGGVASAANDAQTGDTIVLITNGIVGNSVNTPGNVYGGGLGNATYNAHVVAGLNSSSSTGTTSVTMTTGRINNNVFGGGSSNPITVANTADVEASATVAINGGTVLGYVYGGGQNNAVGTTDVTVKGTVGSATDSKNVYGGGLGTGSDSAKVTSTKVDIDGATIYGSVYGGGTSTPHTSYPTVQGSITGAAPVTSSAAAATTVQVRGNVTIAENVFGGGEGQSVVGEAFTTVTTPANAGVSRIGGGVYGGGEDADDIGTDASVGSVRLVLTGTTLNHVHGGGYGKGADVGGNVGITSTANTAILGSIYGGGATANADDSAEVEGNVTLSLTNTAVGGDVYGGGDNTTIGGSYFSSFHTNNFSSTYTHAPSSTSRAGRSNSANVGRNNTNTITVTISGGSVGGGVYGGGDNQATHVNHGATPFTANAIDGSANAGGSTSISISGGTTGIQEVYGGGNNSVNPTTATGTDLNTISNNANVGASATVSITGASNIAGDVYGGGKNRVTVTAAASTISNNARVGTSTSVTRGDTGTVGGSVYGGGDNRIGVATPHARVTNISGNATVGTSATVNYSGTGAVTGSIYGGGDNRVVTATATSLSISGNANVAGGAVVTVNSNTVGGDVYGGGDNRATAPNATTLSNNANITGQAGRSDTAFSVSLTGVTVGGGVYGGGDNRVVSLAPAATFTGNANISIASGMGTSVSITGASNISDGVYGGGDNRVTTNAGVQVIGGNSAGDGNANVFGGGTRVAVGGTTQVGTGTNDDGIYGGGDNRVFTEAATSVRYNANVTGNTAVVVTTTGAVNGNIYGGGDNRVNVGTSSGSLTSLLDNANITNGATTVTITGTPIGPNSLNLGDVFGGGDNRVRNMVTSPGTGTINRNANVANGTVVNITQGTTGSVAGSVYGGGDNKVTAPTATVIGSGTATEGNANVYNGGSTVTISNRTVGGDVYGGGDNRVNNTAAATTISYNANVTGNTITNRTVSVTGVTVGGSVYGGGNNGVVSVAAASAITNNANLSGGTNVLVSGGSVANSVYGGGDNQVITGGGAAAGISNNANITAAGNNGGTRVTVNNSATITNGDVYGGGDNRVVSDDVVTIGGATFGAGNANVTGANNVGTTVVVNGSTLANGSVYGGGDNRVDETGTSKATMIRFNSNVIDGDVSVTLTSIALNGGDVFGGGDNRVVRSGPSASILDNANVTGNVTVSLTNGNVGTTPGDYSVYGGGDNRVRSANADTVQRNANIYGTANTVAVNISGTTVSGSVYGGGNNQVGSIDAFNLSSLTDITENANVQGRASVDIFGGAHVDIDIYGGGDNKISGTVPDTVTMNNNANIGETTYVNIGNAGTSATVDGNIYGGGDNRMLVTGASGALVEDSANIGMNHKATNTSSTYVYINNGGTAIAGSVYGGGDNRVFVENATVNRSANVYGSSGVEVANASSIGTVVNVPGQPRDDGVYGGGDNRINALNATISDSANIYTSTFVQMASLTVNGHIYGGGNNAATNPSAPGASDSVSISDSANVDSTELRINNVRVYGDIYGGGGNHTTMANATIADSANVYTGNVDIIITTNPGIDGSVYGGGNNGALGGSSTRTSITDSANVNGKITIQITGGQVGVNVYGGGNNATDALNITGSANAYSTGKGVDITITSVTVGNPSWGGDVYGGGGGEVQNSFSTVQNTANITGPVKILIQGNSVIMQDVYGGGNVSGGPLNLVSGPNFRNNANIYNGSVEIVIDSSRVVRDVFGGGNAQNHIQLVARTSDVANIHGATDVTIRNNSRVEGVRFQADTVSPRNYTHSYGGVHGGGFYGDVFNTAKVTVTNSTVVGSVYGGGVNSNIAQDGGRIAYTDNKLNSFYGTTGNGVVVFVQDSTTGSIYGGGLDVALSANNSIVYGNASVTVQDTNIDDTVSRVDGALNGGAIFGGGAGGNHVANRARIHATALNLFGTYVTVDGVTFVNQYGSIYGGGANNTVEGSTRVLVRGNVINGDVVGGGRGWGANVIGDTSVTLEDRYYNANTFNVIDGNIFGGGREDNTVAGNGTLKGDTIVTTQRYTQVTGTVYGGGDGSVLTTNSPTGAHVANQVEVHIWGHVDVDVYGGGINSNVGNTSIAPANTIMVRIYGTGMVGTNTNQSRLDTQDGGHVFGGSRNTASTGYPSDYLVTGNTYVEVNGLVRSNVYGGGRRADVTGNTYVVLQTDQYSTNYLDGELLAEIVGDVYGGGSGTGGMAQTYGNTYVFITQTGAVSGKSPDTGHVYGGGRNVGDVFGNTEVVISGKVLTGNVFGGGYEGSVGGNTTVTVTASGFVDEGIGRSGNKFGVSNPPNRANGGSVYGGSWSVNSANGREVRGDTFVNIMGWVGNHVHGGGWRADSQGSGGTTVRIYGDAQVGGNVFGAGREHGDVNGQNGTHVYIYNNALIGDGEGSPALRQDFEGRGYVFGGGYQAHVTGTGAGSGTYVELKDGAVVYFDVFGGSYEGNVTSSGGTTINIYNSFDNPRNYRRSFDYVGGYYEGGYTVGNNVYGGGYGGFVTADSHIDINGSYARIFNDVFGGGTNGEKPSNNTGSDFTINGYSPSNGTPATINDTYIDIHGGANIRERVFGGGQGTGANVLGTTNMDIRDDNQYKTTIGNIEMLAERDGIYNPDTRIMYTDVTPYLRPLDMMTLAIKTPNRDADGNTIVNSYYKSDIKDYYYYRFTHYDPVTLTTKTYTHYFYNPQAWNSSHDLTDLSIPPSTVRGAFYFDEREAFEHAGMTYGGGDYAEVTNSTNMSVDSLKQIIFGRMSGGNLGIQTNTFEGVPRNITINNMGSGDNNLYHDDLLDGYLLLHTLQDFTLTEAYDSYLTLYYNLKTTDDGVTINGLNNHISTMNPLSQFWAIRGVYHPWRPSIHTVIRVEPRVFIYDYANFRMESAYTIQTIDGISPEDGFDTVVLLIDRPEPKRASETKVTSENLDDVQIINTFDFSKLPTTMVPNNIFDALQNAVVGVNFYIPPQEIDPTDGEDTQKGGGSDSDKGTGSGIGSGGGSGTGGSGGGGGAGRGGGGGGGGAGGGAGGSGAAVATVNPSNAELTAAAVNTKVTAAVAAAPGQVVGITERNYDRVSTATLRSMHQTAVQNGGRTILYMDTMNGNTVEGRMYLDPSKAGPADLTILTRVYTRADKVASTTNVFNKHFSNRFAVIHLEHNGPFGMEIQIAAKPDLTGMDTANLRFYSYNRTTNSYKPIANPRYTIDTNGYLRFYTEDGGDIVISEGPLAKK